MKVYIMYYLVCELLFFIPTSRTVSRVLGHKNTPRENLGHFVGGNPPTKVKVKGKHFTH